MLVSYIFIISYSTESSVYASSMALTVGVSSFVGVLIAIYFITRGFTKPIEFLFNSLKEVQTGNYMIETPVVSNDEIGILADNFNHMVKGLRERELIKDTFGKYVTKDVADVILKHGVKLKGEIRVATILVTDIKNYTSITEKMQPTDVVNMLNEYFSILVEIVVKHKGMVNKYMGDSLLAVYNIPIDDLEHTQNAINTALEIQKLTHEKTFGSNKITLNTRIGINTGIVIAGNIGSKDRLEYTVIGDAVNVASRLEQLNKDHNSNILVGENTYQIAKDDFAFDYVGIVNVRGKSEPINVYKVAPKFAEQLLKHKNIF
jgi:adenylate cyclase